MSNAETEFRVVLSGDQALVLFEMLSRSIDDDEPFRVRNGAEYLVLLALQGAMESHLVTPFSPNYRELVRQARQRIQGVSEDFDLVEPYPDDRFNLSGAT